MKEKLYPIGIQSFEKLRTNGFYYVDKTAFIYEMNRKGCVYFLARPRRFGKSLLISTMEAYFSGRKDLFKGLAIEELEHDWTQYPVLRFDMSRAKVDSLTLLNASLDAMLQDYEAIYGGIPEAANENFLLRMSKLIANAKAKTGKNVVVLIDEYDTALLHVMHDRSLFEQFRSILRSFYLPLKICDADLKFAFLTGITKFSQLSIFSELNNLKIISMDDNYASICGISKEELLSNFKEDIAAIGEDNHWSEDETIRRLKKKYDGYHFSQNSPDIYNPFSLLKSFRSKALENYWFSSGTPTFLTRQIAKHHDIDAIDLDKGFWASPGQFDAPVESTDDLIPTLYQSGYLTIKDYKPRRDAYLLAYPNDEVRQGFLRGLLPYYAHEKSIENDTYLLTLMDRLDECDIDGALTLTQSFLSGIPYNATHLDENFYRTVVYLICRLLTPYAVRAEEITAAGHSDVIIETDDAVFCFEFKMNDSPDEAIKQIDEKGYLLPYAASGKKRYKIGVRFDEQLRTLGEWMYEEVV